MSQLPKFMSEESKINYETEVESKNSWLANNVFKMMAWFSVLWFTIVLIYISKFFGWSNLFLMMPDEFGGFLAGVTLPLAIIWVIMAYIDRGTNFKNEAKFLRAYMNQLVYPEEGGASTAKAMADAIRSQVVDLQEVSKHANEQTLSIKNALETKIDEFARLVSVLDTYSTKTIEQFSASVQNLSKNFDNVSDQAHNATNNFKSYSSDFAETAQNISEQMNGLFTNLLPRLNELKSSSVLLRDINIDNTTKLDSANKFLQEFTDISKHIVKSTEEVHQRLDGSINKLGSTLHNQTKTVADYVERLDISTDNLSRKMSEQGDIVSREVDKVVTRSQFISETIENQVVMLNGVAENVINDMENIQSSIEHSHKTLESNSIEASAALSEIIEQIDISALKVADNAQKTIAIVDELDKNVEAKVSDWDDLYNNVAKSLHSISFEIDEKALNVSKTSAQAVIDITEVGSIMDKYSSNLTETCSIVVAQNKLSESSLSQQQKHLHISINALEDARKEIKNQIEELSRAAEVINDEAVVAVNNLKKQMDETLQYSEDVVGRTRVLNESLMQQSHSFDSSTSQTLAKVSNWEEMLKESYMQLDKISTLAHGRYENISSIISKQLQLVDDSTDKSENKYNMILQSFETQTAVLNSVGENTVAYVSDVVHALDEKAESINVLFKHQENTFFDVCDKMAENTSNIANSLKKQVTMIEQSADRVFSRMTVLEEDVKKRADIIAQNSVVSIDKMSDVQKMLELNSEETFNKMKEVAANFNNTSGEIKDRIDSFGNTVQDIQKIAGIASAEILSGCDKMKLVGSELSDESKSTVNVVAAQSNSLESFLNKIKAQSENIKDIFDAQKETLTDVVNVVSTQTRLGESALSQQYKILSDASLDVSQKMTEIQSKFKNNMESVTDISGKIAYEVDSLGDKLINISEDVAKASKDAIKSVTQVNLALCQSGDDLTSVINNSVEKVNLVVKDYEKNVANFNTVTAEASSGVFEINNMILDQSDKMIKISEDTRELVTCFNTVLNDTSLELSGRANFAFDKVKGLGEQLKSLSMQLEESGKMGSKHMEVSGDKLRATMTEIVTNAERISNTILNSGETFLKQSDVLLVTTDDTLVKVKNVMSVLNDSAGKFDVTSNDVLDKTNKFSELVGLQVKALADTSTKADAKLSELLKNYETVKMDSFLKEASYVIEALETSAVDINRLFSPQTEEDLWKKYYNGDNSVFVRHLSRNLNKQEIITIRKLFEQNADFRKTVTKYLSDFEILLSKAQHNERSGILLSVITGADIGRVYYILARALDKLN